MLFIFSLEMQTHNQTLVSWCWRLMKVRNKSMFTRLKGRILLSLFLMLPPDFLIPLCTLAALLRSFSFMKADTSWLGHTMPERSLRASVSQRPFYLDRQTDWPSQEVFPLSKSTLSHANAGLCPGWHWGHAGNIISVTSEVSVTI